MIATNGILLRAALLVALCAVSEGFNANLASRSLLQHVSNSPAAISERMKSLPAVTSSPRSPMWLSSTAAPAEQTSEPKPDLTEKAVPNKTMKKIIPLGLMLFFILFNYTILRDTKDVLVVTAPNSGAEIIPFLKTYVNLPSAIGFTLIYGQLSNKFSAEKVFYTVMTGFLAFFGAFAGIICKLPSILEMLPCKQ